MIFDKVRQIACLFITMSSVGFAGVPLLTITPIYRAPTLLASNSFTAAVYQVTNNTASLSTFYMQPIPGITQNTTNTGACSNPIVLKQGQSCLLNLRIVGSQLPPKVTAGPIICNNAFACSQPSQQNSLNISLSVSGTAAQNTWISVLIAQYEPISDVSTYVNQIIKLAPKLEQIHLRVTPGATNYSFYASIINLLRTAYGPGLIVGYHPDDSSSSYDGWNCTSTPTWQCVLSASISNMNAMNAVADPNKTGQGFNTFSIEQSYVFPADTTTLKNIKACLNPSAAGQGTSCPATPLVIASPVVTFGDVLPSYGGCDPGNLSACEYGSEALDYGYPQYYNKVINLISDYSALVTNGYFPDYSAKNCINNAPFPYTVVDVVFPPAPTFPHPLIPCTSTTNTPDIYTYAAPSTTGPSPTLASSYVAYIMTQLPPISGPTNTNGATVYITFSGEPEFLGAPGWSLDLISEFNTNLNSNFDYLKTTFPALFPSGGADPHTLKYAIWNFSAILTNE